MIDWNDDTPITLQRACEIAFPNGALKPTALKRHARLGNLNVCKPGKWYLTTLRDVRAMLDKISAPKPPPEPDYGMVYPPGLDRDTVSRMALHAAMEEVRRVGDEKKRLERERTAAEHRRLKALREAEAEKSKAKPRKR